MFFDQLLHLRRQRRLHVVGVVLDVVVLQDRLQSSALLFPALLGTRRFGVQFAFGQQRLLRRRQLACFNNFLDCLDPIRFQQQVRRAACSAQALLVVCFFLILMRLRLLLALPNLIYAQSKGLFLPLLIEQPLIQTLTFPRALRAGAIFGTS